MTDAHWLRFPTWNVDLLAEETVRGSRTKPTQREKLASKVRMSDLLGRFSTRSQTGGPHIGQPPVGATPESMDG